MSKQETDKGQMSRRGFLSSTAIAAGGVAAVVGPVAAVKALEGGVKPAPAQPASVVENPSAPSSREPVTAYLRNADTHEVTVMSGTSETTFRDPVLAQRLLDAAGGVADGAGR